ncbi:hypothetical protein [Patulibacter defluvii]|uniref:hypothetical protein n=1 Tax=Patulibacter defluvii TaxID=3095358 RepID=UPI002A760CD9|nr:hypothetical protein [Patulibacter sp. DM4]
MLKHARKALAVAAMAVAALAPASAPAAPTPTQHLDLLPKNWLQPVIDDLDRGEQLGRVVQDLLCPPVTEVHELVDGIPGISSLTDVLKTGACNARVLDYSFHTEFVRPDGTVAVKNIPATLEVPTALDVDDDQAPEFIATLSVFSLDKAKFEIHRVGGVQEHLPVSVEAVIADPSNTARPGQPSDGGFPRQRLAVGYDAKGSDAPTTWTTDVRLTDVFGLEEEDPLKFGATITQTGATGPVAILAELFDRETLAGDRRNRIMTRLEQQQVPARMAADFVFGEQITAHLRTAEPITTKVLARVQDDELDTEERIEATIAKVPRELDLTIATREVTDAQPDDPEISDRAIEFDASEPIERLTADITSRTGAPFYNKVVDTGAVDIRHAPTGLSARLKTIDRRVEKLLITTRGGPVGQIEAAFGTNGVPIEDDQPGAYLKNVDGEGRGRTQYRSTALRLFDVERARIEGTSPEGAGNAILLDAVMKPGPVRAIFEDPDIQAEAFIRDMPHEAHLFIDPTAPRVTYDGSAPIGEIQLEAVSGEPLFARATHLNATIKDVPSTMDLQIKQAGDAIEFVTDNPVGQIDVAASDGHGESLEPEEQGVIYRDQRDRWLLTARIFGLRQVKLTPDPLDVLVRVGEGRSFLAKATIAQDDRPELKLDARIDRLPKRAQLKLTDSDSAGTHVVFDADKPIERLRLTGSNLEMVERAKEINLELDAVPRHVEAKIPESGPIVDATASDPLGRLLIQVADGSLRPLPSNHDGIVYHDTPQEYAISAQVSGLRSARVEEVESDDGSFKLTDVAVDLVDAPRVFAIDMKTMSEDNTATGVPEYVRGYIDRPQPRTEVRLRTPKEGAEGKSELRYRAGGPIDELHLATDKGELGVLDATLSNLPKSLDVCFDAGQRCRTNDSPNQHPEVSLEVTDHGTSQSPMTIDALVCLEPNSELECRSSDHRRKFIRARDMQVGQLVFDAGAPGSPVPVPRVYIDTDHRPVTGTIDYRDDGGFPGTWDGVTAKFPAPDGFRARDRAIIGASTSGDVACGGGTSLSLIGLPDLSLTALLCGL